MGSPPGGPIIANIFMLELKRKVLPTLNKTKAILDTLMTTTITWIKTSVKLVKHNLAEIS